MKLSFLVGAAVGYMLGARAGRARYESIMRSFHRLTRSEPMQSTAGALHAQADDLMGKVRHQVGDRRPGGRSPGS